MNDKNVRIDYNDGMYYREVYYSDNGQLDWKGVMINSKTYGYHEDYNYDGDMFKNGAGYFLNNKKVSDTNDNGYCYIWNREALDE